MPRGLLSVEQHTARAERHHKVGTALADAGDELSAVCFFYAAYHLVVGALVADSIFTDMTRLHAKHHDLVADDRFTSRHHGRRYTSRGREWGVNELVLLLYPQIAKSYEQLHQASIDARYLSGCRIKISVLQQALATIQGAASNGELTA